MLIRQLPPSFHDDTLLPEAREARGSAPGSMASQSPGRRAHPDFVAVEAGVVHGQAERRRCHRYRALGKCVAGPASVAGCLDGRFTISSRLTPFESAFSPCAPNDLRRLSPQGELPSWRLPQSHRSNPGSTERGGSWPGSRQPEFEEAGRDCSGDQALAGLGFLVYATCNWSENSSLSSQNPTRSV